MPTKRTPRRLLYKEAVVRKDRWGWRFLYTGRGWSKAYSNKWNAQRGAVRAGVV